VTSKVIYEGGLRTIATHLRSGTKIETDAPVDNNGKGDRFSPTDLAATSLATCMCTLMGIKGEKKGINIDGTECEIEKIMVANPRRIGEIRISLKFPAHQTYTREEKDLLIDAAITCPVYLSLHPDVKKTTEFIWPDGTSEM
jgi:putative redox protein